MKRRKTAFDDHLDIIQSGVKVASDSTVADGTLLQKLANELKIEGEPVAEVGKVAAAPTAEGEVDPAASSVAGAAPAVVASTEAVVIPQTTLVGGNPAEVAAGEVPAPIKPNEGVAISSGDGMVTDANNLGRTPDAVAAAAIDGGGDEGGQTMPSYDGTKTAEEIEAVKIGELIAKTFQETLEKNAADVEYRNALSFLNDTGYLEGFDIQDNGMDKSASENPTGCLQKLANRQALTREEVVSAAYEADELIKQAADAEAQGRQDAQDLVTSLVKQAGEEDAAVAPTTEAPVAPATTVVSAAPAATEVEAAPAAEAVADSEKVAALINDEDVFNAVTILKKKGLLA